MKSTTLYLTVYQFLQSPGPNKQKEKLFKTTSKRYKKLQKKEKTQVLYQK